VTRPSYTYRSAQESILLPYYRRFVWAPALELIPETIAPNTLTAISTLSCGASFMLAAAFPHDAVAMIAAAVLVFTYLSLDNMDGAQARRVGRSSRLGEFLDHWLDTLNNGFVTLGACLAVGLPPFFSLGVFGVTTLAFYAVQWELRRTGVFRMGRIADVEGNTAVCLLYLTIAFAGPEFFSWRPISALPPLTIWLGIGVGGQAAWTFVDAFRRVSVDRLDLVPITLAFVLLATWAMISGQTTDGHLAIAFFANPVFTSRPVLARLLGKSTVRADWLAIGTLALATIATTTGLIGDAVLPLSWAVAAVFAAIAIWHASHTISTLRGEPSRPTQADAAGDHGSAGTAR
jgi:phosphatidylglycerophosphate synthase